MTELKALAALSLCVFALIAATILGWLLGIFLSLAISFWLTQQYYEYKQTLKAKEQPQQRTRDEKS